MGGLLEQKSAASSRMSRKAHRARRLAVSGATGEDWDRVLGEDLLPWLILAIGGALAVGNLLALVRPPENRDDDDLERPPLARSLMMASLGAVAAIWAGLTLAS